MKLQHSEIKRILFNFLSLPVFSAITIVFFVFLGIYAEPKPQWHDLGGIDLGLIPIYFILCCLILLFIICWWHGKIIHDLKAFENNSFIFYTNIITLLYPYAIVLSIFIYRSVSRTMLNDSINDKIKVSTISSIDLSNAGGDILGYARAHDTNFIITGTSTLSYGVPQTDSASLTIVRLLPKQGNLSQAETMIFPTIRMGSLKIYSCGDSLKATNNITCALDILQDESIADFFSTYPGKTYIGHFKYDSRPVYTDKQTFGIVKGDNIRTRIKGSLNEGMVNGQEVINLTIADDNNSADEYYQPLRGFDYESGWWYEINTSYYDKTDKSYYALVAPEYHKPDSASAQDTRTHLFIARFNKTSIVYKVNFDWKEFRGNEYQPQFLGLFKNGNQLWLLSKKRIYKIDL